MSEFSVGDEIEIVYHLNNEYKGKQGKIIYIGQSLKQGTNMLENDFEEPGKDTRIIVALDDNTIINDIRDIQIRKL